MEKASEVVKPRLPARAKPVAKPTVPERATTLEKPTAVARAKPEAKPLATERATDDTKPNAGERATVPAKPIDAALHTDYHKSMRGLRLLVRGYYDIQAARKVAASRNLKRATPIEVDDRVLNFLDADFHALQQREDDFGKLIRACLAAMPVYREVFEGKYKGLGYLMAAVILSENDIYRQDTPSKLWAFAGLNTVPCERCVSCGDVVAGGKHRVNNKKGEFTFRCEEIRTRESSRAPNLTDGSEVRKDGKKGLPYNAGLRTKMLGVLGGSLIKSGTGYACGACGDATTKAGVHKNAFHPLDNEDGNPCSEVAPTKVASSEWRKTYDDYKHRKATAGWGMSDKHRHSAALRYTVKMLLAQVWADWRAFLELPVREPYPVEKQGRAHHSAEAA